MTLTKESMTEFASWPQGIMGQFVFTVVEFLDISELVPGHRFLYYSKQFIYVYVLVGIYISNVHQSTKLCNEPLERKSTADL